ncbi:hypothetical protein ACQEVF_45945 [Nonomuraea polychroma]|uniref:hypothetical protein n=1 Tax=Nonomuraea polychroma TaxID=46176 RepID=UPI003D924FF1
MPGHDRPAGRLRSEPRLGPDWAADDNDVLWCRHRRAATPHADVSLDEVPGWRLRQTEADHDRHRWSVVAPDGKVAGMVTRTTWHRQAWDAVAGDPASRSYSPVPTEPPPLHRRRGLLISVGG